MTEANVELRLGGEITKIRGKDRWLIITESKKLTERGSVRWLHNCGGEVKQVIRRHSVWYPELGPCVGGGEVLTEAIPYCPNCETPPSEFGVPIDLKPGEFV